MKLFITSDTMGVLPSIEEDCDIFVHCGNFCPPTPKFESLEKQVRWLDDEFAPWIAKIPAKHKIVIPGDMDLAAEYLHPNFQYHIDAIFLKDEATTIDKMVIYGTSWSPPSRRRPEAEVSLFLARNDKIYDAVLDRIPNETNILITRMAPYGILDTGDGKSSGDGKLLNKIESLRSLRMHLFGFVSDEMGNYTIKNNTIFANANVGKSGYLGIEFNQEESR